MNIIKRTFKRIGNFFVNLSFEKPFLKRWFLQMVVYGAFFLQGFLGFITLTLFSRNLTARPSGKLAVQQGVCRDYKKYKVAKAEADEKGEECEVTDPTCAVAMDAEMDDFVERMLNGNKKAEPMRASNRGQIRIQ